VSVSANTRGTSPAVSGLVEGTWYAFRTRATDPTNLTGPWSDWCEFTVDVTAPQVTVALTSTPSGPGQPVSFRLTADDPTVTSFRYGWTSPPTTEVPAIPSYLPPTADITLTVPRYGQNVLYVSAADAAGNRGYASVDFDAARPSPAVAWWDLQTYPGSDRTQALADRQPALAGDTPLAGTPDWASDVRVIGSENTRFSGGSSTALTTTGPVIDTTDSYSVAAWVRLDSTFCTGSRSIATVNGTRNGAFYLNFQCATQRWRMRVADVDADDRTMLDAVAPTPATAGRWTHVAGTWDATERRVQLFIDGILVSSVTADAGWSARHGTGWTAAGPFAVGTHLWEGSTGGFFLGELADLRVYDRVLVPQDFTGTLGTPLGDPGIIAPIEVGRWSFDTDAPCYDDSIAFICNASDSSPWNRRLRLTTGASTEYGHRGSALSLDSTHWIDDPYDPHYGTTTQEFGRSQTDLAAPGYPSDWQDRPVLITDQSFTASAWVRLDQLGNATAVAQRGSQRSAFTLGARQHIVGGVSRYSWTFTVNPSDTSGTAVHAVSPSEIAGTGTWTHLVGVYDAVAGEIRLYVDGSLVDTRPVDQVMAASGPLTVGAAWSTPPASAGSWTEFWTGALDDVSVYQNAFTDAEVERLFDDESI
jgi:hypothetical protein